ncbi:MAG: tyrosine-type recombinase/integrase, partial [Bacteroidota bacterium]
QYLRKERYYIDYSSLKSNKSSKENIVQGKKVLIGNQIADALEYKIESFTKWMAQKRYSRNTINTYESMLLIFFRFHFPKSVIEISEKDVLKFNTDYIMANGFSYTYQNQMINAIKLFYRKQGNKTLIPENLERPKKSKKLPEVLSIEEVKSIIQNTINLKHKTLLSLLYSCGLRIGEALKLRIKDINYQRGFMHVRSAKGSKDRYIPIPKQMIDLLERYLEFYKPTEFIFEGQNGGMYTAVSARQILKRSLHLTGISKPITLHTLRHSHATHLLENGTDLRFIQELLGHNSPKTTMIYTHVSTTSLDRIKNPFDDFDI